MRVFIAYYRVSTQKQGKSGLGLEAQRETVQQYVAGVGGKVLREFTEIESGKHDDRPQLALALAACRVHSAVLCIAKLDRLSRNLLFIAQMMESGAEFIACDMPAANKFTLHIMAAVAQQERELISARTKAALAAAKRRGVVLGGDHGATLSRTQQRNGNAASARIRTQAAQQRRADLLPVIEELRAAGCETLASIADALNSRGITTARGSQWTPTAVMRVVQ